MELTMLRDNSQKTETILYINLFLRLLVIHIEHFIFKKAYKTGMLRFSRLTGNIICIKNS